MAPSGWRSIRTRSSRLRRGVRLVPMLEVGGPVLRQRMAEAAAQVDRAVLLGHPPRVEVLPRLFDRAAVVFHALPAPLQPDEVLGLRLRRPPEVVALVGANGRRQAVGGTEEVQRAGLPVVAREDAGTRAFFWRKGPLRPPPGGAS